MLNRLGHFIARQWLVKNVWRVDAVSAVDEQIAVEIISHHADKEYSYTDATSFAIMERLGIRRAFSFDRHFEQYGFELI
jgi:predicted nucleic acid-binding protein